jgi:CRP/FNR family transcriptional regulator, nitrogen oxide reductase regulator
LQSVITLLRRIHLFNDLPAADLEFLAQNSRQQSLKSGQFLFRQGEDARLCYAVLSGMVRLVQHSVEGKDVTMETFVAGDVFGLVVALMNAHYPGTAEALEDIEVIGFSSDVFWELMRRNMTLSMKVVRMLAERLQEAHSRIRELSVDRVQRRIARTLLRLARKVGVEGTEGQIHLDMRLSRQDLAQMNGATLETVSRTLTAWERDEIISAGREDITIMKPHQLFLIAEDLPE